MLRSRQSDSVLSLCKSALDQHSLILQEQSAIRDSMERDRQEKLMPVVSQAVSNLVSTKLEEVVSNEIKESILPGNSALVLKKCNLFLCLNKSKLN